MRDSALDIGKKPSRADLYSAASEKALSSVSMNSPLWKKIQDRTTSVAVARVIVCARTHRNRFRSPLKRRANFSLSD